MLIFYCSLWKTSELRNKTCLPAEKRSYNNNIMLQCHIYFCHLSSLYTKFLQEQKFTSVEMGVVPIHIGQISMCSGALHIQWKCQFEKLLLLEGIKCVRCHGAASIELQFPNHFILGVSPTDWLTSKKGSTNTHNIGECILSPGESGQVFSSSLVTGEQWEACPVLGVLRFTGYPDISKRYIAHCGREGHWLIIFMLGHNFRWSCPFPW